MKKILILANEEIGFYCFRIELAERLMQEDYEVVLSAPKGMYRDTFEKMGIKRIITPLNRHGTNPLEDIVLFTRYLCMIIREKPSVILTYTIKPNLYGSLAARLCRVPCIANVTGAGILFQNKSLSRSMVSMLMHIAFKKNKCIFFQNRHNMELFQKNRLCGQKAILLPGSGVNLSKHRYQEMPDSTDTVKFLMLGRVCEDKGILEFLQATKIMMDKYANCEFIIAGPSDDDVLQEKVNETASKYPRLHVFGLLSADEASRLIASVHCLVNPSHHEGMSNVLQEAAATGRAVIASDIPGCQEIVDDGVSGFLFQVTNTASLIKAMEKFINLSIDEKKRMGKAGRYKIEQVFDRDIVVNAYLNELLAL